MHAQGAAARAQRRALPRARAARPQRRAAGARVPRRRPARRPLRARRAGARCRAGSCASASRAAGRARADRARRARRRSTRRRSCRSPTATSTSSTASSSTSRARSPTPGYRRLLDALLGGRARCGAELRRAPCTRAGHHAYLGGLLEHTVAVATLAQELALGHPRLDSRPADVRRDRPRHRQDARVHLRRDDRAQRRGPAARPRPDRAADPARARRGGCSTDAPPAARSSTACSATTGRTPPRAGASRSVEALALYRLNALDAERQGRARARARRRASRSARTRRARRSPRRRRPRSARPRRRCRRRAPEQRRPADLGALADLDLLAEGDPAVAGEVERERARGRAGRGVLGDAERRARTCASSSALPAPAKQLTLSVPSAPQRAACRGRSAATASSSASATIDVASGR